MEAKTWPTRRDPVWLHQRPSVRFPRGLFSPVRGTGTKMRLLRTTLCMALLAGPAGAQELVPVNLYVADIVEAAGTIRIGTPRKLTGDRGVNSQPAFMPDGKSILFVARRDSANAQSDIYRIDLATGEETQITRTPEMENSPTVTPDGRLMVIRWVPATLFRDWGPWRYDMQNGVPLDGVLPGADTVGYYVMVDSVTYAMVRPKSKTTVAIFDTRKKTMTDRDGPVANLPPQLIPGTRAISYTRVDSLGHNQITRLEVAGGESTPIAPALRDRIVHSWTPSGMVLMARGNRVFARKPGRDSEWKEIAAFADKELRNVNTYTVSPDGSKLIMISASKPGLHVLLKDALQDGKSVEQALSGIENQQVDELRASYDISRPGLNGLVSERRKLKQADIERLERFVARIVPPQA
jgi:hypothetical protein